MPTNTLTADRRKIQKWIDTAQALRDRQDQRYVHNEITRLLSVKSLCRTPELALRFMAYLAELTVARAADQASPNLPLITQAAETLSRQARRPTSQRRQSLQTLFTQAQAVQHDANQPAERSPLLIRAGRRTCRQMRLRSSPLPETNGRLTPRHR